MTYVVTESCIKCKYTDCVDVCPVDCFHEGPNFLVIDPDECIDCTLCVAECPVEAIFAEDDVPPAQEHFKVLNAELAKAWNTITERCIKCKYTDCVDVCPVDCFREGPNMLVIDPDECIDCTLCVPECPVEAIFAEDDVPDSQKAFIELNRELAQSWKPLIERKPAPEDADEWAKVMEKKHLLEK